MQVSYDKCIDFMGQNRNYLICIFMNLNEIVKNRGNTRGKTVAIAVLDELEDLCCIPGTNSHCGQCSQRYHLNAIKYCPQQ